MLDWFDCLGEEVRPENKAYAVLEARKMGVDMERYSPVTEYTWVCDIANYVESDEPRKAIGRARDILDLTGTHRLMAALCIGPRHGIPRRADGDECHICGEEFDADEWHERHVTGGASAGESWIYQCPNCEVETVDVGT